jgi:hypothetical protein
MIHTLNGRQLVVTTDDAVALMLAIANGWKDGGDVAGHRTVSDSVQDALRTRFIENW